MTKLICWLLFLSCAILPISFQISTIGVMSVCVFVLVHSFINKKGISFKIKRDFFELPIILFIIPIIGLLYTSFVPQTIDLVVKYLPYLIFSIAFFFAHEDIKKNSGEYLRNGIIAGVALTLLYLFIALFLNMNVEDGNSLKEIFSYKYTYRNFIKPLDTHTTYLGLLVLMSNIFVYKSTFKLKYKTILLIINFLGLIFLTSKMILLLYSLQLVSLFFFLKKRKIRILFLVGFLAGTSVLGYFYNNNLRDIYFLQRITREIVWDFDPSNVGTSVNGKVEDDSRLARWSAIILRANDKIFFGHGSGSETILLKDIHTENGMIESIKRNYNAHNQYLFFILEMGLLGITFFFIFLFSNIKYVIKNKSYEIGFLLFSLILISFVENYFNRTMGVLAVSLFFTFLKDKHEKDSPDF